MPHRTLEQIQAHQEAMAESLEVADDPMSRTVAALHRRVAEYTADALRRHALDRTHDAKQVRECEPL